MDPELIALLERLHSDDSPLTDAELTDLQTRIGQIVGDIDAANPSDDDIAVLTEARDATVAIREVQTERATAAAERAAAAADLLADIVPAPAAETEPGAGDGAEGGEGAGDGGDNGEGGGDGAPAEGDGAGTEAGGAEAQGSEVPAPVGDLVPEPVAAGGAPARTSPRLPSISRLAQRRPRSHAPAPTATSHSNGAQRSVLTAAGDLPGIAPGDEVDPHQWAHAAMSRYEALRKVKTSEGDGTMVPFGTIRREFPADRFLDDDHQANEEKIEAVTSLPALTASGGVCAPVAVDYSVVGISQSARPVRDALVNFGATRGGLRYILPHTLASVTADGPASIWTEGNDVALNNPATKPHAVFNCQPVQEAYVDAVTSITQFGNFQSRFFPEQIAQYLEEVDAVHARLAEATLLAAMTAGSTAVAGGLDLLGATSEVLAIVDRAAAALRYRHRMAPETPLRLLYPEWLEDMLRTDLARRLPGDSGGQSERLAIADAEIDRWFAVRGINVTNTQDSPTGASSFQGFAAQGPGLLNPWPSHVLMWLFPEGSWMFLDGGELNLGMVRDSTLNRTNDYQMFEESFEKAIFRGHESLVINLEVCPSGQTAATVSDTSFCTSGS